MNTKLLEVVTPMSIYQNVSMPLPAAIPTGWSFYNRNGQPLYHDDVTNKSDYDT